MLQILLIFNIAHICLCNLVRTSSSAHCTVNDQKSHTGYSNTGSYRGQDMTRHTNITQSSTTGEKQKTNKAEVNTTQTKPNQEITKEQLNEQEGEGGECATVQGKCGLSCKCSGDRKSTCVEVSPVTHTDTWTAHTHTDTDRFTITVTVPVQLVG